MALFEPDCGKVMFIGLTENRSKLFYALAFYSLQGIKTFIILPGDTNNKRRIGSLVVVVK